MMFPRLRFLRAGLSPRIWIIGGCVAFFIYVATLLHLFAGPVQGIADQGDFERMMIWIGASYKPEVQNIRYFEWIHRYYTLGKPVVGSMISSEIPLLWIARVVNDVAHPGLFDLKVLGFVHLTAFCVAWYFLLWQCWRWKRWLVVPIFLMTALFFSDVGYASYFTSMYQESSGLTYALLFVGTLIKAVVERNQEATRRNMAYVCIASMLLITAKPQYFILSVPNAFISYFIFRKHATPLFRVMAATLTVVFGIGYYAFAAPKVIQQWNIYNSVYAQALHDTRDLPRTMRLLGIDSKTATYAGTSAYDEGNGLHDPSVSSSLTLFLYVRLLGYYMATPYELTAIATTIASRSFSNVVDYLGYAEYGSGAPPLARPQGFRGWGLVKEAVFRRMSVALPWALILIPLLLFIRYRGTKKDEWLIGSYLGVAAASQFWLITLSEGTIGGTEKHLFLYQIYFDLLVGYLILLLGSVLAKRHF